MIFCFQSGRMNSSRRLHTSSRNGKPQVIDHTIDHPKIEAPQPLPRWQIAVQKDVKVGPIPLVVKPV